MGAAAPAASAAAWAKCFATAAQEEGSEVEARGMAGDGLGQKKSGIYVVFIMIMVMKILDMPTHKGEYSYHSKLPLPM